MYSQLLTTPQVYVVLDIVQGLEGYAHASIHSVARVELGYGVEACLMEA